MNVVIIEDEDLGRKMLRSLLSEMDQVSIVGEATNGYEGLKLIEKEKPDLIFLDIRMPKLNGFEMLELLDGEYPVIFTTAYNEYAIKAFEVNAIDYLLKPFSKERLASSVEKYNSKSKGMNVEDLALSSHDLIKRIAIKSNKGIEIVAIDEVDYIESCNDYVIIHEGKLQHVKNQTMRYFENNLPQSKFIRIHRTYIVNLLSIKRIIKQGKEAYTCLLKSGQELKVSKAGFKLLKEKLNL